MIIRKGPEEIERIAAAGDLVAATIAHVGEHIEPGITTVQLDEIAGDFIAAHGGIPASKGYHGYPPRSASRRTRWSCTASRAIASSRTAT